MDDGGAALSMLNGPNSASSTTNGQGEEEGRSSVATPSPKADLVMADEDDGDSTALGPLSIDTGKGEWISPAGERLAAPVNGAEDDYQIVNAGEYLTVLLFLSIVCLIAVCE